MIRTSDPCTISSQRMCTTSFAGLGYRMSWSFAELDEGFGRTEGDEEIQELLQKSKGLNLGLHCLSGAITYDPVVTTADGDLASRIVWLDAFLTNTFLRSANLPATIKAT